MASPMSLTTSPAKVLDGVPGTVTPIRTATNTALKPITVGRAPDAIAVSPDGPTAYVANNDSNTITPIKTAGNKALKPVKVGKQPSALVLTPHGRTLYVVDYTTDDGPRVHHPSPNLPPTLMAFRPARPNAQDTVYLTGRNADRVTRAVEAMPGGGDRLWGEVLDVAYPEAAGRPAA